MLIADGHLVVQNPIILHDSARSHTAAAVTDLLHRWQWEILERPSYSPDMNARNYDLFAKVKTACLVWWLARLTTTQEVLSSIPDYTLEIFREV